MGAAGVRARRVFAVTTAFALASALGGCGFTPLYAEPGVSSGLSAVTVNVPQGRVAYLLREDLDDALAHDAGATPAWRLDVSLFQTRQPRGLRLDDVAERYEVGLTVKYRLISVATGDVAYAGQVSTEVSYDAANAPYAGIAARQNSQELVASDAARRIQLDLAAWMARHRGG